MLCTNEKNYIAPLIWWFHPGFVLVLGVHVTQWVGESYIQDFCCDNNGTFLGHVQHISSNEMKHEPHLVGEFLIHLHDLSCNSVIMMQLQFAPGPKLNGFPTFKTKWNNSPWHTSSKIAWHQRLLLLPQKWKKQSKQKRKVLPKRRKSQAMKRERDVPWLGS